MLHNDNNWHLISISAVYILLYYLLWLFEKCMNIPFLELIFEISYQQCFYLKYSLKWEYGHTHTHTHWVLKLHMNCDSIKLGINLENENVLYCVELCCVVFYSLLCFIKIISNKELDSKQNFTSYFQNSRWQWRDC